MTPTTIRQVSSFAILALLLGVGEPPPARASEDPDKLTLEVVNVEILDVLKLLSKKSGLNIVAGPEVKGQVSVFLKDVPVREGLKTILQSQALAYYEEDDILKVVTARDYEEKFGRPFGDVRRTRAYSLSHASAADLANALNGLKSPAGKILVEERSNTIVVTDTPAVLDEMDRVVEAGDAPQVTREIKVRYAKAEDLEGRLRELLKGGRGEVAVDKRSNKVFVTDIPSRVEAMVKMIEAFDVLSPQVLIEAKVIEVRLSDTHRQGIDWNSIAEYFNASVPLTVSAPAGGSLATFTSVRGDLTAILQLIERMGKTNTLSSPRITALDGEEASLAVATKQPFVSQTVVQTQNSTNTADNVQFVDVGVTLKVSPRILSDDLIEMRIKPQVSASSSSLELEGVASGSNTTFTRTSIPIVTTQELETSVTVRSGSTIIVGGLIQDVQDKQSQRLPVLGRIPIAGQLFASKSDQFEKTELVMFLTPTLVDQRASASFERQQGRFFDAEGDLKAHEAVGDHHGANSLTERTVLEQGQLPYWKKDVPAAEARR